jgi:hypothetical protein
LNDPDLAQRLEQYRQQQTQDVLANPIPGTHPGTTV